MSVNKKSCLFENSQLGSNSQSIYKTTTSTIVDDCLGGKIELAAVPDNLRAIGITPEAAQDYIEQITRRIGERRRVLEFEPRHPIT